VRALASDDIIVTGRGPAVEPYRERIAVVLAPVRLGGGMRVKVLQAMGMRKAVVTTPLALRVFLVRVTLFLSPSVRLLRRSQSPQRHCWLHVRSAMRLAVRREHL
jgi:hypothetical protein